MPTFAAHALLAIVVVFSPGCEKKPAAMGEHAPIKVAAASDLTFAFAEVAAAFEKKSGRKVTFSFGSTGNLAKQLAEGAPFDAFAAANVSFVDDVVKAGACDGATKALYGTGRIVVWTRRGDVAKPAQLGDLTDTRFTKVAIANPEHAPYGRAAKEAMEKLGLWEQIKPKIVYGENIKQTMQFAESGNAEAAIVALSLAIVDDKGEYLLIDASLHNRIDQAIAACKRGGNEAGGREFVAFVGSPEGRAIMKKFGFASPGESGGP